MAYLPLAQIAARLTWTGRNRSRAGHCCDPAKRGRRYAAGRDQPIWSKHPWRQKSGKHYRKVPGISAATILSDGRRADADASSISYALNRDQMRMAITAA